MPRKGLPDRWLDYSNFGKPVRGTKFIAFKVPLNESFCSRLPPAEHWTPKMLLRDIPDLGMVIDLTNTNRYYDGQIFKKKLQFVKIPCQGHGRLPQAHTMDMFFSAVDSFLKSSNNSGQLVGVHCTHGLNRTGFFICRYMIDRLGFSPEEAVSAFNESRGHCMERMEYVNALERKGHHSRLSPHPPPPPMWSSQMPESDVVNRTRTNFVTLRSDQSNHGGSHLTQPPYEAFQEPSQYLPSSRNHNMTSFHSNNQYVSSTSGQSRPERYDSRILYPKHVAQPIVSHQPIAYRGGSCKARTLMPFQNCESHKDGTFQRLMKPSSIQDNTALNQDTHFYNTLYPNQQLGKNMETEASHSYNNWTEFGELQYQKSGAETCNMYSAPFDRPSYSKPWQGESGDSPSTNSYNFSTYFDRSTYSNQDEKYGAETRDSYTTRAASRGGSSQFYGRYPMNDRSSENGYAERTESDKPHFGVYNYDASPSGTRSQSPMKKEVPAQVGRGTSNYYRKPYRPFRRT